MNETPNNETVEEAPIDRFLKSNWGVKQDVPHSENTHTGAKVMLFLGIVASVVLIIVGCSIDIPSKQIPWLHGDEAYVGGDAYNYIIESNFRSSDIQTKSIQKTVCIVSSVMLFFVCLNGYQIVVSRKDKS